MSMTESENIQATFEDAMYCVKTWSGEGHCEECRMYPLCHTFCDDTARIIVNALEEIQQYRAIGTVEGYERAIQISIENYNLYREYKAKVQEFEAIGTVSEFAELKEKATAKKPVPYVPDCASINFIEFVCPNCKGDVPQMLTPRYCDCGQKLDWSEGKEQ